MKKRLFSIVLALCLTLTLLPATALADTSTSGTCGDHATWALTQNNTDAANPTYTLTISGTGAMANYANAAEQPWNAVIGSITKIVVNSGVTAIGDRAFMNAENAVTVTLPDGLDKIGQRAFANCHKLQSPTFPTTLKEIGANPFYQCNAFDTIVLPDGLTTMGEMLFYECANLRSITIPANATSLPEEFVKGCAKLEAVQIPAGITSIGQAAFAGTGLKEITIPATVTTLGKSLFYGCSSLEKVTFEGSAKVQSATFGNCTKLKMIVFTAANFDIHYEVNNPVFNTGSDRCVIILANSEISAESIAAVNSTFQEKVGGYTDASPAIALVLRGGTVTGEAWGSDNSLATPTRTGYAFVGWYDNAAFGGEAVTTATKGTVYYAKWQRLNVVTFNANGGTVDPASAYVDTDGKLMLSALPAATRAGYRFLGWYTEATGGDQISLDRSYTADTTVYAQWQLIPAVSLPVGSVNVSGSLNGSVSVNHDSAREGTIVTVTVNPNAGYVLDSLTVTDQNGKAITVTHVSGNKYSFIMPDGKVTVRASFTDGLSTGFVDVPADKYFYNAVNWAVANGITSGTDATHFSPYASCTRGQLVTFLWRAAGQPAAKATENAFGDVKETSSFYKAILWAAENGIVTGYDDGTFQPNKAISRQQTAAILYRYAKYAGMDVSVGEDTNILSFNDALSVSEYAVSAFQWATGAQVITGNGANLLPYDTCTRAQIVTMLYRLLAK